MDIIDSHVHITLNDATSSMKETLLLEQLLENGQRINVLNIVLEHSKNLPRNLLALLLKIRNPDKVYAFGGIVMETKKTATGFFEKQVSMLKVSGFDGIKLFGKPSVRRLRPYSFAHEMYDELYAKIEKEQMPINFHIGDPKTFWSARTIPELARKKGWCYQGEAVPSLDEMLDELEEIITRFPDMKVIVPHMMFKSDNLKFLTDLLMRYPNLYTDITPGVELFYILSKNHERAHDFFTQFKSRIFYGTDNAISLEDLDTIQACHQTSDTVLRFLEYTNEFVGFGGKLHGLGLSKKIIRKICTGNFQELCGDVPRATDLKDALIYCEFLLELAKVQHDTCAQEEIQNIIKYIKKIYDRQDG